MTCQAKSQLFGCLLVKTGHPTNDDEENSDQNSTFGSLALSLSLPLSFPHFFTVPTPDLTFFCCLPPAPPTKENKHLTLLNFSVVSQVLLLKISDSMIYLDSSLLTVVLGCRHDWCHDWGMPHIAKPRCSPHPA